MKTKHTPGPWKINNWSSNNYIGIEIKTDNREVCIMAQDNAILNAKLIAAAPENLQEHFSCVELLDSVSKLIDAEKYPVIMEQIKMQVTRSNSVIKKATE